MRWYSVLGGVEGLGVRARIRGLVLMVMVHSIVKPGAWYVRVFGVYEKIELCRRLSVTDVLQMSVTPTDSP